MISQRIKSGICLVARSTPTRPFSAVMTSYLPVNSNISVVPSRISILSSIIRIVFLFLICNYLFSYANLQVHLYLKLTLNEVPLCTSDSNSICPAINSMYRFTIFKPNPVPGILPVLCALKKGSNKCT
ncbi:hypothetical protein D3C71_1611690 [compost metagenome]